MYRVYVNDETKKDVRVNFQGAYDFIIEKGIEHNSSFRDLLDGFNNGINDFMNKDYVALKNCIDVLGDNDYYITCEDEEKALEVEKYFENNFANIENNIVDFFDELDCLLEDNII